ncbi:hypothetical protein [Kribbella sp. NPDC050470]|uniref:hypothetical protein n=1 Tax=unclassified Kribbella TaxID=2644121 RepID=UPI0037A156FC
MVEPVKQDWASGEKTKATGRVAFLVAETLVGTKGAGRAASTASAASRTTGTAASKAATKTAVTAAGRCSFAAAITVLMADGTHKPIAEVKPGDKVIASDPETGEQSAKVVTHVWHMTTR